MKWFDYDNLKSYPQIGEDFISKISIIDLIMNVGEKINRIFTKCTIE